MHLPREAVVNIVDPPQSITGFWPRQAAQMQQAQQAWCSPAVVVSQYRWIACGDGCGARYPSHCSFLKAQMLQAAQFQAQLQVHPARGKWVGSGGTLFDWHSRDLLFFSWMG